jgi:GT2 family glycosyltransferase
VSTPEQTPICIVSVIIPTRNRAEKIRACLTALAAQTLPPAQYEVVVVDDGSEQSLKPVIADFANRLPVRLIEQPSAGPAKARNAGAASARGELLAFTDDDCEPAPDWLAVLCASHKRAPDKAIGGHTVNSVDGNVYSEASQLLVDYLYDYNARKARSTDGPGPVAASPAPPAFFTSNNLAVGSRLFAAVGGFGASFSLAAGEDREFCDRWQQNGYQLLYVPEAVVRHGHVLSLARFWRQHANYGHGASDLRRARVERGMPRMRMEPLSFYLGLVAYPLRRASSRRWTLMGLMVVSQVANATGFLKAKLRGR